MTGTELWVAGLIALPALLAGYAYAGYPLLLRTAILVGAGREGARKTGRGRRAGTGAGGEREAPGPVRWPKISILVPAYNEAGRIEETLDSLLRLEYPGERQILVVSDASSDGTDRIVRGFEEHGVELLSLRRRRGKTKAQGAAAPHLEGEIVVNVDASISVPPGSLEPLIRAFRDPSVGVASGRDVSVGASDVEDSRAEQNYVGYEMWVRSLETRLGSIVGASGCFYAARKEVFTTALPEGVSRDFGSVLIAREQGYRSIAVDDAICLVPRSGSLGAEFRRKSRTMTRGLQTLAYKRHLLNPLRYGGFAFMLFSHKLCRWAVPLAVVPAMVGLLLWGGRSPVVAAALAAAAVAGGLGALALRDSERVRLPRFATSGLFFAAANLAALVAWKNLLRGRGGVSTWEPTRRPGADVRS